VPPRIVGGEIPEPRKVKTVEPRYPEDARRAGLAGVVVLECTIGPEGDVSAVKALRSVPPLTDAAIEAVKHWRYTPTLLNGVAVPVIMKVTVNFKLDEVRYGDLLTSLDHPSEPIREAAARNLGTLRAGGRIDEGNIRKAIRALEPLAEKDASPIVREAAARALSLLDGRTQPPPSPPPARRGEPRVRPVAWGAFVDPLGQCDITADRDRIEIGVPPGAYDLSIELGQTTAPRVMQLVDGDLVARVSVDELPQPAAPAATQPRRAYRGAGLLLWQDDRNYVRLESAVTGVDRSSVRYVLFETRRDGKPVGGLAGSGVRLRGGPTDLRLQRHGRELVAMARQGNEDWREVGRAEVDLPRALGIGVSVVNTSASALRATLSGFSLVTEPRSARSGVPSPGAEGLPAEGDSPATVLKPGGAGAVLDYDAPPQVLEIQKPTYPREAYDKRIEGTVLLEILIDSEGRVARRRVIQSVPGLDEAALACVASWRFKPAVKGGKPVPTIAHVPLSFRIE
jgi:TonB family protein